MMQKTLRLFLVLNKALYTCDRLQPYIEQLGSVAAMRNHHQEQSLAQMPHCGSPRPRRHAHSLQQEQA